MMVDRKGGCGFFVDYLFPGRQTLGALGRGEQSNGHAAQYRSWRLNTNFQLRECRLCESLGYGLGLLCR